MITVKHLSDSPQNCRAVALKLNAKVLSLRSRFDESMPSRTPSSRAFENCMQKAHGYYIPDKPNYYSITFTRSNIESDCNRGKNEMEMLTNCSYSFFVKI